MSSDAAQQFRSSRRRLQIGGGLVLLEAGETTPTRGSSVGRGPSEWVLLRGPAAALVAQPDAQNCIPVFGRAKLKVRIMTHLCAARRIGVSLRPP